jgi:hypothetical protein
VTAGRAGTGVLGLRYGRLVVRVGSAEPSHLAWLRDFLTPSFEVVPARRPDWTVRLVVDPSAYEQALAHGPEPGGRVMPCFWLDTEIVHLPLWAGSGPGWTVLDRRGRAFLVGGAAPAVDILAAGDGPGVRTTLMRVVRELAMAEARRCGGLVLHAAAVAAGARVILIAGPKGAGKTTLLVHLLRSAGTRFVANDRVVTLAGEPAAVRGLPTIVKLLRESAEWFPALRARLADSPYDHRLTLAETAGRAPEADAAARGAWTLSPAQFCALVGTEPVPGGPVGAVVFPRQTGEPGPAAWRRLSLAEAAAALAEAQLGSLRAAPPEGGLPAWMRAPAAPAVAVPTGVPASDEERCRRLAARVPAYEVALGRDAYADPASAGRLLEAVGA